MTGYGFIPPVRRLIKLLGRSEFDFYIRYNLRGLNKP